MELATGIKIGPASVLDTTTFVAGIDTDLIGEFLDVEVIAGSLDALNGNRISTTRSFADNNDLSLGDTIEVGFARTGTQQFELAVIIDIGAATDTTWSAWQRVSPSIKAGSRLKLP